MISNYFWCDFNFVDMDVDNGCMNGSFMDVLNMVEDRQTYFTSRYGLALKIFVILN